MRDAAYEASVELAARARRLPAVQCRPVPERQAASPPRLPQPLKRPHPPAHGLRNSHLLSIAPTGTISLAFADNASNGIEPAFSWTYTARSACPTAASSEYAVEDHAWRLYRHLQGADAPLTPAFVTALEMSARPMRHGGAVAPYIDTAISKTVNVPADYPYADFQGLYLQAWRAGLKGLATYRPNSGAGLGAEHHAHRWRRAAGGPCADAIDDANRRLALERLPAPVLASLRWPGRPELPAGNPAWTFMVQHPHGDFALFVGELPEAGGTARAQPFEVWVNGAEQPRGLGALAKTLSMDLRANDPPGCSSSSTRWPPWPRSAPSRCPSRPRREAPVPRRGGGHRGGDPLALRAARRAAAGRRASRPTPVMDAMFSRDEPHTGPSARWPGRWTSTTRPPAKPSR
jgi:ribonucleoside-diphosphate reductase alpha chain